jgi:hypothetical protein
MLARAMVLSRAGTRAVVLLALLGHAAGALGVPLPRAAATAPPARACGCPAEERAARSCCCGTARSSCCGKPKKAAAPTHSGGWLVSLLARQCHGADPFGLLTLPPALPAGPAVSQFVEPPPAPLAVIVTSVFAAGPARPPIPPPRG